MRIPILIGTIFLVLGAAQNASGKSSFDACMDKSSGVTVAMRECYGPELQRLDRTLAGIYRKTLAQTAQGPALEKSQKDWLAWRKAQCDYFFASADGGTIEYMMIDGCYEELTKQRIAELQGRRPLPRCGNHPTCLAADLVRTDKDLNAIYRKVVANAADNAKPDLVRAERAWIAFRDADFAWRATSSSDDTHARCIFATTQDQAKQLRPFQDGGP